MKKILVTGVALSLILTGCSLGELNKNAKGKRMSVEAAQAKVEKFINENLMQPGTKATVEKPVLENGLYKVKVGLPGGRTVDTFMTTDGNQFFPQAIDMSTYGQDEAAPEAGADKGDEKAAASKPVTKSDKPKVELFVMSYCPYGTQIEKGIIPAVEKLGNKIDFNLRFVNYAMHDKQEVDENLLQYCIQKEDKGKLFGYLKCFLKDGKSKECLASAKVNTAKVNACVKSADKQFKITENYNNKDTWQGQFPPFNTDKDLNEKYGVQGSPTLVINGSQAEAGRDSASLLKAICGAMKKPGKECEAKLSSATPAPGFGDGTAASGSADAGCGQ